MKSEIVAGIDIGTSKIAVIISRQNDLGNTEILGFGWQELVGVRRELIANSEKAALLIQSAIRQAEMISGVNITRVNVNITGQYIQSYQYRGKMIRANSDFISKEELDKFTSGIYYVPIKQDEKVHEVILHDYIIDDEKGIKWAEGMSAFKIEANFLIITVKKTAITKTLQCVNKARFKVD